MRTTAMRAVAPVIWRLRSPSAAAISASLAIGHPLAVVFDGADALIAGGHQGIAPGGELREVGHVTPRGSGTSHGGR